MTRPVDSTTTGETSERGAVGRARRRAGLLVLAALIPTAVSGVLPLRARVEFLAMPAALAGLVGPVIGYRLYLLFRERIDADSEVGERCRGFVRATTYALSITAAIAVAGAILFALTHEVATLVGALGHVLLAGAIWPSAERLEAFLEESPASDPAGPS